MRKTRDLATPVIGQRRFSIYSPWQDYSIVPYYLEEVMESGNHPMPPGRFNFDQGGPMSHTKHSVVRIGSRPVGGPSGPTSFANTLRGLAYLGSPLSQPSSFSPTGPKSAQEMRGLGTTAIARTEPTNPAFSASTAFGELAKDGIPSLIGAQSWRSRSLSARNAGSEYLNVEFGWKPLIADIRKFAYAANESEKILDSYHKDSGRKIRKRYHFPGDTQTFMANVEFAAFPPLTPLGRPSGTITKTRVQKTWFSGAFKYYLPDSSSIVDKFRRYGSDARKLLGVELTPEVVWNLAPWSWAADWFTNTGDLMHNISAMGRDGLVMQYGYMMDEEVYTNSYQASNDVFSASRHETILRQLRYKASPYGFDADLTKLSPRQIAILTALGLSRT